MSDNFHFDITGASLEASMAVALTSWKNVKGWRIEEAADRKDGIKRPRLILYWTESSKANPLPAPLAGEALLGFIKSWLETAPYGPQPDHDGDNGRGWRVYNESWGHVADEWQAFAAIEPVWLMYGK
jgi:hypothetical protein